MAVIEDDEPVTTKFHPEEALVRSQDANMIFCTIRFQYKEQKHPLLRGEKGPKK